jgi:hypothetical protein
MPAPAPANEVLTAARAATSLFEEAVERRAAPPQLNPYPACL